MEGDMSVLRSGDMSDRRYNAMMHAVDLARSGLCNNWWSVKARLRARRYREADVEWTRGQQKWLDQLCMEARLAALNPDTSRPCA
jgi:hypothetical protein